MPRFVLLYHECPPNYDRPSHWDFMLEAGEVLATWSLKQLPREWRTIHGQTQATNPDCPALSKQNRVPAQRLTDHRRDFLEFEGELTNNRGRVTRVAEGTFVAETNSGSRRFARLSSSTLSCSIELDRRGDEETMWLLSVRK